MNICITSIQELLENRGILIKSEIVDVLFSEDFRDNAFKIVYVKLKSLFKSMRSDLCVVIETNYVDKDYRDAYYRYYATKFKNFNRNCIRLSFFEKDAEPELSSIITSCETECNLQNKYLGFAVLRPLFQCLGRNIISPRAMKNPAELSIIGVNVDGSCMGLKLSVWGFPHASQDGQIMTCAETTVWSMSEYFGEKYSLYSRVFPHNIIDLLHDNSYQRQIPSEGLTYTMISHALLKQGLSPRVYHANNKMFKEILTCYIESEFPIVLAIQGEGFGHAIVCIGRKNVSKENILSNGLTELFEHNAYIWNRGIDYFIANDDNMPPYSIFDFDNPCSHYEEDWGETRISSMIVPLHPKIYVEAEKAIQLSNYRVLHMGEFDTPVIKTFLTTSRSFKEFVQKNRDIGLEEKWVLLQLDTPKFLWVTEVSTKEDFLQNKVNRILLIDPTADSNCGTEAIIDYIAFDKPILAFRNLQIK